MLQRDEIAAQRVIVLPHLVGRLLLLMRRLQRLFPVAQLARELADVVTGALQSADGAIPLVSKRDVLKLLVAILSRRLLQARL